MGVLWLVPARTMRPTAAACLLPFTSHAIRKHLRDRAGGAGVALDFMTKRNSELVDIRDGAPTTRSVPRLAMGRSSECAAEMPASARAQNSRAMGRMTRVRRVEGASTSPLAQIIRIGEIDLRVLDQGEGAPVVLLHGFPDRAEEWRHVGERLRARSADDRAGPTWVRRELGAGWSRRLSHRSRARRSQWATRRAQRVRAGRRRWSRLGRVCRLDVVLR
jgi:hypothetical protein